MDDEYVLMDDKDPIYQEIPHLTSWDADFTTELKRTLPEFLCELNNKFYPVSEDVSIIRLKAGRNEYKPNNYNPLYLIVYQKRFVVCEIIVHVFSWSTTYVTKVYCLKIRDIQPLLNNFTSNLRPFIEKYLFKLV